MTTKHLSLVEINSVFEHYTHVTILGYPIALITSTLIILFVRDVESFKKKKSKQQKIVKKISRILIIWQTHIEPTKVLL